MRLQSRETTRSPMLPCAVLLGLLVPGVLTAQEQPGFYLREGVIPAASDYQGVAVGDATEQVYLYLTRERAQGRLLRWEGNRAIDVPLTEERNPGSEAGAGWADYDADGDLDLYVSRFRLPDLFYDNVDGRFDAVADGAGFGDSGPGQGVSWLDFDGDGDLDLHVARFGQPNLLYAQGPVKTFKNVARDARIDDGGASTCGLWGDFDGDGDPDLYVVNYQGPDRLFLNEDGRFVDASRKHGLGDEGAGVSAAWVDYDNDGDLDLSLSRYDAADRLMQNDGGGLKARFNDVAPKVRLDERGQGQMTAWGDFDRDGDLDVYVVNGGEGRDISRLYRNQEGGFVDASVETGLIDRSSGAARQSKAAVWWDADGDGDLDLTTIARGEGTGLYGNQGLGGNRRWLALRLGAESGANPHALGGKVVVQSEGRQTVVAVNGATSYLSQGSQRAFVGLGNARVDSVEVVWPEEGEQILRRTSLDGQQVISKSPAVAFVVRGRLDFGSVSSPLAKEMPIYVRNDGGSNLRITGAEFQTDGVERSRFTLKESIWPIVIAPGETRALSTMFRPNADGPIRANLLLEANVPVPTIRLDGRGAGKGEIIVLGPRGPMSPGQRGTLVIENKWTAAIMVKEIKVERGTTNYSIDDVSVTPTRDYSIGPGESLKRSLRVRNDARDGVADVKVVCQLPDGTVLVESAAVHVRWYPLSAGLTPGTGMSFHDAARLGPVSLAVGSGLLWLVSWDDWKDANRDLERSAFPRYFEGYRSNAERAEKAMYIAGAGVVVGLGLEYWWRSKGDPGVSPRVELRGDGQGAIALRLIREW